MPIVFLSAIVVFAAGECIRARLYIASAESYKQSVEVLELQDAVEMLQRSAENDTAGLYCKIQLLSDQSSSSPNYSVTTKANSVTRNAAALHDQIYEHIRYIDTPPSYSSLLDVLPKPKEATSLSIEMSQAVDRIKSLTVKDERSQYCLKLEEAIGKIAFIRELSRPEGVEALLVGQLDNYRNNVQKSVVEVNNIYPPKAYADEHLRIIGVLTELSETINMNDRDAEAFSDRVGKHAIDIAATLERISAKSSDLKNIPYEIGLSAEQLKNSD